jgi:hypothetical protein
MSQAMKRSFSNINVNKCAVCFEDLKDVNICVTKCGHKFCTTCLFKSLEVKKECPCCRSDIFDIGKNKCEKLNEESINHLIFLNKDNLIRQNFLSIIKQKLNNLIKNIIECYSKNICNCSKSLCIRKIFSNDELIKLFDLFHILERQEGYNELLNIFFNTLINDISLSQLIHVKKMQDSPY